MDITTIIIPAVLIAPVREGSYAVSRDVGAGIDLGEDLRVCRERLAGVCRLLDAIGWTQDDPASDTELDLAVHTATLRSAIAIMTPILHDAPGERELYEALRDFTATELPNAPQRLTIPAEVVLLLREVLYVELERRADELTEVVYHRPIDPAGLTDPLARLDGERALLEEIGWSKPKQQQPREIDFARHGQTVVDALETDLDTQLHLADTDDPRQREPATAIATLIERFLAELKGRECHRNCVGMSEGDRYAYYCAGSR
ncbi:MAG TPA: hypothetical protein VK272_13780 [Solirubrobacteraceae bacterium]|nr:hypothetical protein [Solirubrobacteraceae bacterium]